jgi:hypothetical protein
MDEVNGPPGGWGTPDKEPVEEEDTEEEEEEDGGGGGRTEDGRGMREEGLTSLLSDSISAADAAASAAEVCNSN